MAKKASTITVKATNGVEFILARDVMSSMHFGDVNDKHWAHRKSIKAAFLNGDSVRTGGPYLREQSLEEYWGQTDGFEVIKNGVSIIIGCMRFSGVQFKRLRKWATGK